MSGLPELTAVLTKIAGELRRTNALALNIEDDDDGVSTTIASLTKSLNDHSSSGVRVLDAALSLMCLKTKEVCRYRMERLVQTMISVLCSSVSCKISRFGRESPEFLQVGCPISFGDCAELLKVGADVLESLEADSGLAHALLHAILRAAVSSSVCREPFPWPSNIDRENEITSTSRRNAISRLLCFLSDKSLENSHEVPMRLFFWYLDPLLLKNDISEVLWEAIQRPFLSLKAEFYNRLTWRRIIICLVTSPAMFIQTKALLHRWFLLTGLTSVLELQIALVSSVLDMVSMPMCWGVSMELGLKFPFLHAYFPRNSHELLSLLTGPFSCNAFLDLVHHIKLTDNHDQTICYSSEDIFGHETMMGAIENNSTWAMLMNFPNWFYFAAVLLFYNKNIQDSYISKILFLEGNFDSANERDLNEASIQYLSWILSPVNREHGERLAEHFHNMPRSWSSVNRATSSYEQCSSVGKHNKVLLGSRKKPRVSKVYDYKLNSLAHEDSFAALLMWLREFDGVFVKLWAMSSLRPVSIASMKSKNLFLKIPLGLLILCPEYLGDKGCELLLYYATTGEAFPSTERPIETNDYHEHDITLWFGSDGKRWALNGACLIFSIFDIIEDMSMVLFECENTRLDYICHLKGKVCRYLTGCVKMLLHLCIQQLDVVGGRVGLLDLFRRLIRWKKQGREVFEGCGEFDNVIDGFEMKFSVSQEQNEES